ncbi:MAG: acyltransferase [Robiginitomaculum sp.]
MMISKIHDGHDNFFTPLRIIMAIMVVFGHAAVVLAGNSDVEPRLFLEYTPSYTAVNAFFIVSGFLVTKSMMYRKDLAAYSAARILRIFPALLIHVLIVTLVVGLLFTTLSIGQYFTHPDVFLQPLKVLSFYETDMELPGAFANNPESIGSAALWTLRYEVLAYIATAIAFALGLLNRRWKIAAQYIVCAIAYPLALRTGLYDALPATGQALLRFGMAYGLGAAIYAYREQIKVHLLAIPALFGLAYLLKGQPEVEIVFNLAIAMTVFWLAYVKAPKLNFLQKFSDVSYGIYIYHWAILQCIVALNPAINSLPLTLITIAISTIIAWLSWVIIEKPALASKARLARFFARKTSAA